MLLLGECLTATLSGRCLNVFKQVFPDYVWHSLFCFCLLFLLPFCFFLTATDIILFNSFLEVPYSHAFFVSCTVKERAESL